MRLLCAILLLLVSASTPLRSLPKSLPSRRGALLGLSGLVAAPAASFALFESPQQQALLGMATAQPKIRGLITEVTDVKRRRVKMAVDTEDDAYVFRFARSVMDPQVASMQKASSAIPGDAAERIKAEYQKAIAALDAGCRANEAESELDALVGADKALTEFLELAKQAKYDVRPREDINGYEGSTPILYNKFLFRSG